MHKSFEFKSQAKIKSLILLNKKNAIKLKSIT